MANVIAKNARQAGDILVWAPDGADTPVVYQYVCPVDNHVLVSAVRLGYNSADTPALVGEQLCPVHHATLGSESAIDVS